MDLKWVDRQKGDKVRSRIVARQFATKSLEHLFAGTPDATVLRPILSNRATDKDKVLLVADVTSAYYQAPVVIDQYVRSPTDQRVRGKIWKLKRPMPSLRIASRSWQDHSLTRVRLRNGKMERFRLSGVTTWLVLVTDQTWR